MKNLRAGFITEIMKLKSSKIFWITICFFIFIPLMMGFLMFVSSHPEIAEKMGMVGTKAKLFGQNDWKGFANLLNQTNAGIGLVGFGFVTSWVFGREYTEHTIIDILALPTSRTSIVISKFIIVFIWSILLGITMYSSSLLIGNFMNIPGWSNKILVLFTQKFIIVTFLTILLITVFAFIASFSRGIIAPLASVIFIMIISQFAGIAGVGPYFPWAIPGMLTVPPNTEGLQLGLCSYIIVFVTSALGLAATIIWWLRADQH